MNPTPDDCFHLSVPVIEEIHAESLARFGGSPGTRDQTLLESAAAAPQAGFAGQSIFKDLIEVAAELDDFTSPAAPAVVRWFAHD